MAYDLPIPQIRLNGSTEVPLQDPAADEWVHPKLPPLSILEIPGRQSFEQQIENRFWMHVVRDTSVQSHQRQFWPRELLEHLFDRFAINGVIEELIRRGDLSKKVGERPHSMRSSSAYWTNRVLGTTTDSRTYRLVLVVLILSNKTSCLKNFMRENFDDSKLHHLQPPASSHYTHMAPFSEKAFTNWRQNEARNFYEYRCKLLVPFLAKSRLPGQVSQYHFDFDSILPWKVLSLGASSSPQMTDSDSLPGGFGEVQKIVIHAWQHGFHDDLRRISASPSLFALKRLYSRSEIEFHEEVSQLERFGGRHPHIVTLLSTVTQEDGQSTKRYLLFPWADSDLLAYWQVENRQPRDHRFIKWVAEQLSGMADALNYIHDPNLTINNKRVYGRHGDIKPENVLCFKGKGQGKLVLSDLGLTRTHGDQSRSNRPGELIPTTPNYRPPECDIDGKKGHVSRDFDIWTMGCLFLEFMVWILDGWEGYKDFQNRRFSPYINGGETCVYFDIVRTGQDEYAFKVKDVVIKAGEPGKFPWKITPLILSPRNSSDSTHTQSVLSTFTTC
ncbi:serine/threonine protein kinase [Colletotrichum tofieldiae]|uniref:Serine/threonine protein kinase n=1 Tax=Colletotrichum tofieldiae TaxID=708197 RepID=A0A166U2X7_9PEZI|nr:serine/threonine protein kinase [Colletotrichum tofieldiae]